MKKQRGEIVLPSEFLKAMIGQFAEMEWSVIYVILCYTNGEGRKSAPIALSTFVKETGIEKSNVNKVIKGLTKRRVIIATGEPKWHGAREYRVNYKTQEWVLRKKKKVSRLKVVQTTEPEEVKEVGNPTPVVVVEATTLEERMASYRPPVPVVDIKAPLNVENVTGKPTLEEAVAYFTQSGFSKEVGERFFYYYDSKGWNAGNSPILNWKSKAMEIMASPNRYKFIFEDTNEFENRQNGGNQRHVDRGKGAIDPEQIKRLLKQVNY